MTMVEPGQEPTPEPAASFQGELRVIEELEAELAALSAELAAVDADERDLEVPLPGIIDAIGDEAEGEG